MKKITGTLAVLVFISSLAGAELLKDFKYDGSIEVDAYKANNADYNKDLSDTKNGTLTRLMLDTSFDLNEDAGAVVSAVKNNRNYGTGPEPVSDAAGASVLGNLFFQQAYLNLKGVFGIDHKVGRQYYGEAGDMVIYYGPLMMPYTPALTVNALDAWTGWWKDGKWRANALLGKQLRAAGTADTNIYGLTAGYMPNDNLDLGVYFYQRSKQAVGIANDDLDVVGVKVKGKETRTGINYKGELAQDMGDNTSVATTFAAASSKTKYTGTAVKVDLDRDLTCMGNWNFAGEFAMGTGDKNFTDKSVKGFMAITPDFRPGLVFGGYNALATGLNNLTTWNLAANYSNDKLPKLSGMLKYYNLSLSQKLGGASSIGSELDFTATWKHSESVSVVGSAGEFAPAKKFAALTSVRHDAETRLGADLIVKF